TYMREVVGIRGWLSLPGSLPGDLALQHLLQGREVPTLERGCRSTLKGIIHSVVAELFLPRGQTTGPVPALLTVQFGGKQRLRPGCPQVEEEATRLAIGIIQVFPLFQVCFRDRLQRWECIASTVRLKERPDLVEQVANFAYRRASIPVRFGGAHVVQTMDSAP